jgi:hypothetical protein
LNVVLVINKNEGCALAEIVLTIKQARPPLVIIMNKVVLLLVSVARGGSVAVSIRACSCKGKVANAKITLHIVYINISAKSNALRASNELNSLLITLRLFMHLWDANIHQFRNEKWCNFYKKI